MESIHHYCQLLSACFAYRLLHSAGVRAMRYARWVQGYHATFYVLATHKVTIHIVQHFVAVYIAVVVWGRYGERVIVVQPWHKRAHHKVVRIKCLVHGWWLVHAACNGFKVVYAEGVWVFATIPADHIKRVMTVPYGVQQALLFYLYQVFALQVEGFEVLRLAEVALAEW